MKAVRTIVIVLCVIALGIYGAAWFVEQSREDPTRPTLTSDVEVLELPCAYSQEQMLSGLHAYDERDGDLTGEILVGDISRFQQEGTCEVTYVVFDSSNQPATLTRKTRFTDYHSPQFTLSEPLIFREGEGESAITYVGASDIIDGNISSLVRMVESDVNYRLAGEYSIQVEVTNSFGDMQQASLPVHIIEGSNAALQINLTSPLVYVSKGASFDPNEYVEDVEDADGNVVGTEGLAADSQVNTQEEGCYQVHYQITNEQGLTGETWLTVIVRE